MVRNGENGLCWVIFFCLCAVLASAQTPMAPGDHSHEIKLGYLTSMLSDVDRKDAHVALKVWTENLSKDEGIHFQTYSEIFDSLEDMEKALLEKKIDMVSFSALDYLRIRKKIPVEPEIASAWSDSPFAVEMLLVRADSGISSIEQLKGKSLIIEKLATGGLPQIWLDVQLMKRGFPLHQKFMDPVKYVDKANAAVTPVFFKQATACVVRETGFQTMVEMNPQIGKQLKVIDQSPPCLRAFACYRPGYNRDDRVTLNKSAVKLHKTEKGRQILTLFKTEKIIPYDPSFLHSTEALVAEYEALKAKQGK